MGMPVAKSISLMSPAARHAQAAVVDPGAGAFLGHEHLVLDRVVDHARHDLALVLQGDRDRPVRQAVQEVDRAVERIDDPAAGRVLALHLGALLAEPAVGRARLGQFVADDLLGLEVGAADEVARALGGDLQVLDLAEIAQEAARRLAGRLDHDVHVGRGLGHWRGPVGKQRALSPLAGGAASPDRRAAQGSALQLRRAGPRTRRDPSLRVSTNFSCLWG